ncbi:ferredoxin [Metaclostridioides mangenotii]|jgi:ferredoxin|uniref:Ferredoxin n=1 Tax=Metaclostridioides mangenotii TaxID=1540 RepID=A0ABS4E7T1_9FIRM|nr:ferredoxin [Clostridioides mangenotii]MBP1854000.1 ferredoxin [Clostridioides mangenotii]
MKAKVDKDLCIGCGLCPSICPEIFSMDDSSDKAVASDKEIGKDLVDTAKEAENSCPVNAIVVE